MNDHNALDQRSLAPLAWRERTREKESDTKRTLASCFVAVLVALLCLAGTNEARAEAWVTKGTGAYAAAGATITVKIEKDEDYVASGVERIRWSFSQSANVPTGWLVQLMPMRGTNTLAIWELNENQNQPAYPSSGYPIIELVNTNTVVKYEIYSNGGPGGTWQSRGFRATYTVGMKYYAGVNVTNTSKLPMWVRVTHPADGQLFLGLLQPGQNLNQTWEVSNEQNLVVAVKYEGEETDSGWSVPSDPGSNPPAPDDPGFEVPGIDQPGGTVPPTIPVAPGDPVPPPPPPPGEPGTPPPPPPPGVPESKGKGNPVWKPTPPTAPGDELDKETFKQGVKQITDEIDKERALGKDAAAAVNANSQAMSTALTEKAAQVAEAIPDAQGSVNMPSSSVTSAYEITSFTSDQAQRLVGFNTLHFSPAAIWPDWLSFATIMRDLFLIGLCIHFAFLQQKKFTELLMALYYTGEKTTKVEPGQMTVPLLGHGKQLTTAITMTGIMVLMVTGTVGLMNANFSALTAGTTAVNIIYTVTGSAASAFSGILSTSYNLLNAFIPLPAIFEFVGLHYVFGWASLAIATTALHFAKLFHI